MTFCVLMLARVASWLALLARSDDAVVRNSRVGHTEIPGIGFEGKRAF